MFDSGTARGFFAILPRLDLAGPRSNWQRNRYVLGIAKPLQVARPSRINKWVKRSAAQAAMLRGAKRTLIYLEGRSEQQTTTQQTKLMFKTCAQPVQTTRQKHGTTFHIKRTNPQAKKLPAFLSPTKPSKITHNRTHFLHSFVDKITEVKNHLSKTSTAPTTTITTYI